MKTICTKNGNKSIHLFDDDCTIDIKDNKIFVKNGSNPILVLSNSLQYIVYENISSPDNWDCGKYRYYKDRGWIRCSEWELPYDRVFWTLQQKHLQLVQFLYEKSVISDDELLILVDATDLEKEIKKYKK